MKILAKVIFLAAIFVGYSSVSVASASEFSASVTSAKYCQYNDFGIMVCWA